MVFFHRPRLGCCELEHFRCFVELLQHGVSLCQVAQYSGVVIPRLSSRFQPLQGSASITQPKVINTEKQIDKVVGRPHCPCLFKQPNGSMILSLLMELKPLFSARTRTGCLDPEQRSRRRMASSRVRAAPEYRTDKTRGAAARVWQDQRTR